MNLTERFLRYVAINTQSAEAETIPSTACQWDLIRLLEEDMKELGISDVRVSPEGYVFGQIPANVPGSIPAIGLIAHMDTAGEYSGKDVKPRIIRNYTGGTVVLNQALGLSMSPEQFPSLAAGIGKDLIVTDGTTLLGADDKAGVTEILCAAEYLLSHPEIPHGKICIGFTPDEEVGRGADAFDVQDFGADFAYTVDGGLLGELEYENFNAATAVLRFTGNVIHPGEAKGKMVNAALLAMEFNQAIPAGETPADTEGREGFYHLLRMQGDVAAAESVYIIRDHDKTLFEERKETFRRIAAELQKKYGEERIRLSLRDSYYNMIEKIRPHMELIEIAEAAMKEQGVTPRVLPVRGGTDGARLSYMGLPCPNLCTGGANFHGPYEFAVIQDMETIRDILVSIVRRFAEET